VIEHPITVPTCRLDSALQDSAGPIALWIDVEGAAARVVDGLKGIADQVSFICIELEPRALWEGQVESSQVLDKLAALGFHEVARSEEWSEGGLGQIDVLLTHDVSSAMLVSARAMATVLRAVVRVLSRLRA
jgi:hypothetical protein